MDESIIMKSRYWEKLWHDILNDPKLGPLPREVKWTFVSLILVAGMQPEPRDGTLPPLPELAWLTRTTEDALRVDLPALAQRELVELLPDGRWKVSNYAKRQTAMTNAERVARYRAGQPERKEKNRSATTEAEAEAEVDIVTHRVTNRYTNVTQETDIAAAATAFPTQEPEAEPVFQTARDVLKHYGVAINATTKQLLKLEPDYVAAHLDAAIQQEEKVGLAIRRMLDGDPAPEPSLPPNTYRIPPGWEDVIKH